MKESNNTFILNTFKNNYDFTGGVLICDNNKAETFFINESAASFINLNNKPIEIGSLTKFFTAICIYKLMSEKKIESGDKVSKHSVIKLDLPIIELLTHTSGLPDIFDLFSTQQLSLFNSLDELLEVGGVKEKLQPRGDFYYSNLGYLILGRLIEEISGKNYFEFLNQCLGFEFHHLNAQTDSGMILNSRLNITKLNTDVPTISSSDGGIVTTFQNMAEFYKAFFQGDKVLSEIQRKAFFDLFAEDSYYMWGMYNDFGGNILHHEGATFKQKSLIIFDREDYGFCFVNTCSYDLEIYDLVEDVKNIFENKQVIIFNKKSFIPKKIKKKINGKYYDYVNNQKVSLKFLKNKAILVNKKSKQIFIFHYDGIVFKSVHRDIYLNCKSDMTIELNVYGQKITLKKID